MASIFTHPVFPLALRVALGSGRVPGRLLAAGVVASWLPDADVLGMSFGIPY